MPDTVRADLDEVFRRDDRLVVGVAARVLGETDQAEDVAQEVFLALLAAQTTVLLTLAVLLSTAISPMASGVVAVGLFCTTWVAGVVGGVGTSVGNAAVERIGSVSRMLLPTDGL